MKDESPIPERFERASKVISVQPAKKLLELGSGAGILAQMILKSSERTQLVAIDQSPSMTKKAILRLKNFIDDGRAIVLCKAIDQMTLQEKFDAVIAFNVNTFWKGSVKDFEAMKKVTHRDGRWLVFYDSPGESINPVINKIKSHLELHNVKVLCVEEIKMKRGVMCCISATPH